MSHQYPPAAHRDIDRRLTGGQRRHDDPLATLPLQWLMRLHEAGLKALQSGDTTELLRGVLEPAMQLTSAAFGCVHVVDEETRPTHQSMPKPLDGRHQEAGLERRGSP